MSATSAKTVIVVCCLLVLAAGVGIWTGGCGSGSDAELPDASTSTTAAATSTTGPATYPLTVPPSTVPADTATAPAPGPAADGSPSPETTIFTGVTSPAGALRSLTFLGLVSRDTWEKLRQIVMAANDDGLRVLDETAKLAAGDAVPIGDDELDTWRGIGYTAGASSSQPVGVATDSAGNQVLVYSYTVLGDPDATTIVGFERGTGHVELVVGPLPIDDSTPNMTTVPPAPAE